MFDPIFKLIREISANTDPAQIALAISLAMVFSFTPLWTLHNLIVLLLLFILKINWATFFAAWGLFTILAFILDPMFHDVGNYLLTMDSMTATWTSMYNTNFWHLENFNNTIALGSLTISLILFIPVFIFSKWLIIRYRKHIVEYVQKSRILKIAKANKWLSPFLPELGN